AIEVSLKPVTNGLMQQHAGPTWTEHDFHFASRGLAGIQLQHSLAPCFLGEILGSLLAEEEIECDASAASRAPTGGIGFVTRDAGDVQSRQRLRVLCVGAVGSNDQDVSQLIGIVRSDFFDSRIKSSC